MFARCSRTLTLAGCLLLPLAACAPETEVEETPAPITEELPATETAPVELAQAADAYVAAWNSDDLAALTAFFIEDATAQIGDQAYTGREALVTNWLQPRQAISSDLASNQTSAERSGDDWRLAGTFTVTVTEPGAEPVSTGGRYVNTWTRTPEGEWRLRSSEVVRDAQPQN